MEDDIFKEVGEEEKLEKANEIVEIDENQEVENTQYDLESPVDDKKKDEKKRREKKISKWSKLPKKTKIIIIVSSVLVILVIAILLVYFLVLKKNNAKEENKEPLVVIENDNYRYEDGTLVFVDGDKKDLGTYECTNKNESLCYVAYYSNEDEFDVAKKVYENGKNVDIRSDIILDNYVFIYDSNKKDNGELVLYNIDKKEKLDTYELVKKVSDDEVIVKKDDQYGLLGFSDKKVTEEIKFSYDYMGYIEDGKYLVVANNKNYQLIDFDNKEMSKVLPGEIKNYDENNISVLVNGKYYVYGYDAKVKVIDSYDYVRFVDSYVIVVLNKKLMVFDKDGYRMTGDGIRINSSSYNTKLIFNDQDKQTGKEEAFNVSVNGSTMQVTYDDTYTNVNLKEGVFNRSLSYVSYFGGKLYFYKDEAKTELLGSYVCSYANNIENEGNGLQNCFIAREGNIYNPDNKSTNYLPIYNSRYVFIADTKNPDANDNIILYDLKNSKKLATYKVVDANYHADNNLINFIDTAGTLVMAKNTSDSYGLINIESSSVDGVISFKDKETGYTNTTVKLLGTDYLVIKKSDNTYHLYDFKGNEITSKVSTKYEIVEYKDNYVKVRNDNIYMIYDLDGKVVSGEYKYILMDSKFYITVDSKNKLGVYKYYDKNNYVLEDITVSDGDSLKDIKYGLRGNILMITYVTDGKTQVVEVNIG